MVESKAYSGLEARLRASIIIPAYNAQGTIGDCLRAVLHQSLPQSSYEVIVVDDGSTDGTATITRQFDVKLVQQRNQGPAIARNTGAAIAQGDILLFTDADCAPAYDWLEKMLAPFESGEVVGAKGTYRTHQRELVARLVQIEYEEKYQRMARERYIDFIDTYSAAYSREVFQASGGFDPSFPVPSAEDQELAIRIAEAGNKMVFAPQAVVYHFHPTTWATYCRRKARYGYWRVLVHWKHPKKALRDSHTLQVQKVQMALAGAILLGMASVPISSFGIPAAALAVTAFVVSSLAFVRRAARQGLELGVAALPFLFMRATSLLIGVLVGAVTLPFRFAARAAKSSVQHTKER
ncbi:MAG: glycosyl transferase family 2 [Dehalococcoidia bacterium]|nr:glycosyl transferase family 2 [Dehalococcoidia bacterium]